VAIHYDRHHSPERGGKNGAIDLQGLDGVLQDLGFAPKPHPTIFSENGPDALFDGLEKFQKANGLTVDGAGKSKDSETGRALNKAMEEFYNPSEGRRDGGTQDGPESEQRPEVILTGTNPGRPEPKPKPETGSGTAQELIRQWWAVFDKIGKMIEKFVAPFTDQEYREYTDLSRKLEKQRRDIERALGALGVKHP